MMLAWESDKSRMKSHAEKFLWLCSWNYDQLIEKMEQLKKSGSEEAILAWVEMMASFAAMHHPGRFVDGTIENFALEIGSDLPRKRGRQCQPVLSLGSNLSKTSSKRRVLHVTTFINASGGHPRVILNWILKDPYSQHSLVLTKQQSNPIFSKLVDEVRLSGGQFVSLPDEVPIIERARWLRRFAYENADLVILHTVPNDIVPVVAFAEEDKVPVAFVNNADHLFWVSSSVADIIINLRQISEIANKEVRYTRNDKLLPLPLSETHQNLSRRCARENLGIPETQIMLISVGRTTKYRPSHRQNFFQTANEILDRNRNAHLYIVGPNKQDHEGTSSDFLHNRMHFVGPVEDATIWQKASDVYLEGFPFGSQTALLESVLQGIPCVRVFAPLSPLLAADDIVLTGLIEAPKNEQEYIEQACDFINNQSKRKVVGDELRERVLDNHVNDSWNQYLENIYQTLRNLKHKPTKVPEMEGSCRPIDLAISEYHGARFLGYDLNLALRKIVQNECILGAAYSLRQSGFHFDAFLFFRMSNLRQKLGWKLISVIGKLLIHKCKYEVDKFFST